MMTKNNLLYNTKEIPGFFLLLKIYIFIAHNEDTASFIFHTVKISFLFDNIFLLYFLEAPPGKGSQFIFWKGRHICYERTWLSPKEQKVDEVILSLIRDLSHFLDTLKT